MSTTSYKRLQRAIAKDDKHSIESRWEYGRAILADPRKMSASGKSLRHGATETLIADAKSVGTTLSPTEIRYRIQCARAYSTRAEIAKAIGDFGSWSELIAANFPSVEVDEIPSPDSVLDDIEATDPQEFEQLGLFPPTIKMVPLERCTLRQLVAYGEEMRRMTESYAHRDEVRAAHLRELCAAVGGDLDVLYPEAVELLAARADA